MSLACLPRRPAVGYLCLVDVSDTSITDFLAVHSKTAVVIVAACVFVSLSLIARLWVVHSSVGPQKGSLVDSVVVPLLGWTFYGAFFQPASVSENRAPTEHSRHAICASGDYPPHI
jgi:hypothetical protein